MTSSSPPFSYSWIDLANLHSENAYQLSKTQAASGTIKTYLSPDRSTCCAVGSVRKSAILVSRKLKAAKWLIPDELVKALRSISRSGAQVGITIETKLVKLNDYTWEPHTVILLS